MIVYLAHIGSYDARGCIGAFSTFEKAEAAIKADPDYRFELDRIAYHNACNEREGLSVRETWVPDIEAFELDGERA